MATNLNTRLLEIIIGSKEELEFLQKKLAFLEKLTNEYDSVVFKERLINIVDKADEISFDGLIYQIYKHIGELAINYLLCSDEWFQEYGILNYDVIEEYNIPAPSGINTVYDSILEEFDLENITDSDIEKFKQQIIKDFNLQEKILLNTSVLEFEENLAYENKQMGDFLESLGFTPDDITSLIINGDAAQKAKALKRAKAPIEFKLNSILAQQILDLLNEKLFHSDTAFTHDSEKSRIFIEIGNDLDDEEFKDGYKSLKEILGVSNLDTFILVDY